MLLADFIYRDINWFLISFPINQIMNKTMLDRFEHCNVRPVELAGELTLKVLLSILTSGDPFRGTLPFVRGNARIGRVSFGLACHRYNAARQRFRRILVGPFFVDALHRLVTSSLAVHISRPVVRHWHVLVLQQLRATA